MSASNGELRFRRALPGDRDRAMRLLSKFADDYLPEVWEQWVHAAPGGIYLAETGPALVGVVSIHFLRPEEAFLAGMRVDPDCQGQGLGTRFCRFQVQEAFRLGARVVRLTTAHDNVRVHRMMPKVGFARAGEWIIREMPWPLRSSSFCHQTSPVADPADEGAGGVSQGEEAERVVAFLRGRATGLTDLGVPLISPPGDVWCMRSLDWAEEVGVLELSAGASGAEDGGLALALGVSDTTGAIRGGALVYVGPNWDGRCTFSVRWLEVDPEWEGDLLELLARHAWRQGAERFGFSLPLDRAAVLDRWLDGLWPGRDQPGDGGCQPGDAGCLPPDSSAWREHFYVYEIREPAPPRL